MVRHNKERRTYRRRRSDANRTRRSLTSAFRTPKSQLAVLAITALVIVLLVLWGNNRANTIPSTGLPDQISVSEAFEKY